MKKLYVALMLMSFSAFVQAQEIVKFKVKENKVPCEGVAPMECLQVKEGKEKEWKNFYSSIAGFDFVPGYTYRLKVEKTKKEGIIPADASAYSYKLKKVVCKKKVKTNSKKVTAMDFLDKKLIVTQLNGKPVSGDKIYFTFNANDKTISGKSACNRFNATYKISGNSIEINPGMSTMMACDDSSMQLEYEFNNTFSLAKQVEQNGNKVTFKDNNGKVLLETNIPTAKDIWSFIDGKEFKLFMLDNVGMDYGKAVIRFDVKTNKVSGNSGCNNFFGSYEATEDRIKFSSLASTKMACLDEDKSNTETKVLQYLSDNNLKYDVAEQTINFYLNDRLVMMFGLQY